MSFNNLVSQALQGVSFKDRSTRYAFETNWSNGEVVQRGSGTNYGENGFLRPGWPHRKLVDYLYGRVLEHYEIGADFYDVVTRDWKVKLAAGIVPRGLEVDALFVESLEYELEKTLKAKFEDEVKDSMGLTNLSSELTSAISKEFDSISKASRSDAAFGGYRDVQASSGTNGVVQGTGRLIGAVLLALHLIIDYAVEMRDQNTRVSSEAFNQPKPVDSIIDDFAVEAQTFANALAESAAYASATIALTLSANKTENIISALLGVWNISISFNTVTNVCRYRNRNEEARRKICDEKMSSIKKAVYSLMRVDQRESFDNPFAENLDNLVEGFVAKARYYNTGESMIASFESAYSRVKSSPSDESRSIEFIRQLLQEFIPGTFHVNSYLQEHLVCIYEALDEMLSLARLSPASGVAGAEELYRDLLQFQPALEASIERGPIVFGFVRKHEHWYQNPLPATLGYVLRPFLWRGHIVNRTFAVLQRAKALQNMDGAVATLSRPVSDLTELHFATKESEVASMVIFSSSVVFYFSIFFSFFRLIEFVLDSYPKWLQKLLAILPWTSLVSLIGSLLAINHFARKLGHLFRLASALSVMKSDARVQRILVVTKIQEFVVFVRLLVSVAATIALPWALLVMQFDDEINNQSILQRLPVYVAVFATGAAIFALALFFLVEFFVRYNLDPMLGKVVRALMSPSKHATEIYAVFVSVVGVNFACGHSLIQYFCLFVCPSINHHETGV